MSDNATSAPFNWRAHLKVHPAADEFPLLSEKDPKALQELAEDIKRNGLRKPVIVLHYKSGECILMDGRNRLDALALLGWLHPKRERETVEHEAVYEKLFPLEINGGDFYHDGEGYGRAESFDFRPYYRGGDRAIRDEIVSLNLHRRHLDAEAKRDVIAKLLKANPEQSNRTIAKQVKADDKTVAKVRREMQSTADIPQLEKTVGADGKARKQPAKKSERVPTELEALREHASKLGYKVRKRGDSYCLIRADGTAHSSIEGTDSGSIAAIHYALYMEEGKIASAIYTPCGSMRTGDNSKVWLAANPGATMEDFEKALPPAPTGCDLDDESPEASPLQPSDDADASAKAHEQPSSKPEREARKLPAKPPRSAEEICADINGATKGIIESGIEAIRVVGALASSFTDEFLDDAAATDELRAEIRWAADEWTKLADKLDKIALTHSTVDAEAA